MTTAREAVSRDGRGRRRAGMAALLAGLLLAGAGCARAGGEIGGGVPETPLLLTGTDPAPFSTVEPFGGPVRIRFQRTLSERPSQGSPADAVVVSPQSGEVSVRAGRGGLEISMEGGFRERAIYRVTVLPLFRDRYGNGMDGPVELLFSTGPELEPNLLAGIVSDFLTLDPVAGVRVDAVPAEGGPISSAVADSAGIFAFPHLPSGPYRIRAYEDRNRNREPDFAEPQDQAEIGLNLGDTLVVTSLLLLEPDTTPAFLETVSMEDSLVIRAVFDDYVDVASLESAQGTVVREGANAPEVLEILPLAVWRARSAEPDDPLPPNALRPTRDLAIVLSRPLLPEVEYRVEVAGIANVNGVPEGGGSQPLEVAAPPAPPPPADAPQGLDPDAPPPEPAGAPGPADGPPAGTPDPTPDPAPAGDPAPGGGGAPPGNLASPANLSVPNGSGGGLRGPSGSDSG